MANETLTSTLAGRAGEILAKEILLLLHEESALRNHLALVYAGDAGASGTATIRASAMGLMGYDSMAEVAEGASVGVTELSDAAYDVLVRPFRQAYSISDLARITDASGALSDPAVFAANAVQMQANKLCGLVADLASGYSQSAGVTNTVLTVSTVLSAIAQLEASNADCSSILGLLHPVGWGQLRESTRQETGPLQLTEASQAVMNARGKSFKATYLGIDFFTSPQVSTATAGVDRLGMLTTRGGVIHADAGFVPDPSAVAVYADRIMVEWERQGLAGQGHVISHWYGGVAQGIDEAACSILHKAV